MNSQSRNQSLDVLRGVAVLLVLGRHSPSAPHLWREIGWWGVDLFFVLSGFLISGILFQDYKQLGRIRLARFWVRRGWKIWPAFFAYLVIVHLLLPSFPSRAIAISAVFVSDYFHTGLGFLGHTWSLSVEEHFYFLLPIALIFLARNSFSAVPFISLAFLALSPVLRCFGSQEIAAHATHARLDGLLSGVALGYLYHFRPEVFAKLARSSVAIPIVILCLPIVALLGDVEVKRRSAVFGFSLLAIAFTFLVAWAVPRKSSLLLLPVAKIGFFSYSIYLWHTFVVTLFALAHREQMFLTYLVTAIGVGVCAGLLVEIPSLRLRDWISNSNVVARSAVTAQLSTSKS